ncbi:MAG: adenosylcobinamide-GDP ribazoletransferase [Acidimicrobiales bacterium]
MKSKQERVAQLREAASFLTPFVSTRGRPSPGAMAYFPVVGAGLGLFTGGVWRLARRSLAPLPAAVVVVAADVALTGALHLDGVADTADGLLAHVPEKGRLAIMEEPEVGTFGTVALTVALLGRVAAFAAIEPSLLLTAALWSCSRSLMVIGSRTLPYARGEGLATAFLAGDENDVMVLAAAAAGMAGSGLAAWLTHGRRGLLGVVGGSVAGATVLGCARKRLGGFTGDVLGAAGVTCETVGLLIVAGPRPQPAE